MRVEIMFLPQRSFAQQRGIALVVVMIFLVLMSLIATSALQSTILDEKMAGNFQQKNRAFEAAEATLRAAETYLDANTVANSAFVADCSDGLCEPNYTTPVWTSNNTSWQRSVKPVLGFTYQGWETGGLACSKPCYLIEHVVAPADTATSLVVGSSYSVPPSTAEYYRITSRAIQQSSDKQYKVEVMLQSIYKK
jgi:type IV pilus assembly protein PilX